MEIETYNKLLLKLVKIRNQRKEEGTIHNPQQFRNVILAMSMAWMNNEGRWGEADRDWE